jgi:hypothetical protein
VSTNVPTGARGHLDPASDSRTREKLETVSGSVEAFKPTDNVSKELAAIYKALLTEVKNDHGDDPVVAAIEPPGEDMIGHPIMDAGTMGAAIRQLLSVF